MGVALGQDPLFSVEKMGELSWCAGAYLRSRHPSVVGTIEAYHNGYAEGMQADCDGGKKYNKIIMGNKQGSRVYCASATRVVLI